MKRKNTMLLVLLIGILLNVSCQNQKVEDSKKYFMKNLEKAENHKDIKQIELIYDDNAVLWLVLHMKMNLHCLLQKMEK